MRKLIISCASTSNLQNIIIISEGSKHRRKHEILKELTLKGIEVGIAHERKDYFVIIMPPRLSILLIDGQTGIFLGFHPPWVLVSTRRRQISFPSQDTFLILLFIVFFSYIFFEILNDNFEVAHLLQQLLMMTATLKGIPCTYVLRHPIKDSRLSNITFPLLSLLLGTHYCLILLQEIYIEQILIEGPWTHRPIIYLLVISEGGCACIIGGLTHFFSQNKRLWTEVLLSAINEKKSSGNGIQELYGDRDSQGSVGNVLGIDWIGRKLAWKFRMIESI